MTSEIKSAITNEQLLEEIIKSRRELQNIIEENIEASEIRLSQKICLLDNKVNELERENSYLKEKIEILERESKRKNVIIFGIKGPGRITPEYVCEELKRLLEIDLTETDISDIYPLGKNLTSPIKVEFCSHIKKILVLKNCYKLKGKPISIASDLTQRQRDDNKILRKHLKQTKEKGDSSRCFIRNNKLFVDGTSYSAKDLETNRISESIQQSNSSAPFSPETEIATYSREVTTEVNQEAYTRSGGKKNQTESHVPQKNLRSRGGIQRGKDN